MNRLRVVLQGKQKGAASFATAPKNRASSIR